MPILDKVLFPRAHDMAPVNFRLTSGSACGCAYFCLMICRHMSLSLRSHVTFHLGTKKNIFPCQLKGFNMLVFRCTQMQHNMQLFTGQFIAVKGFQTGVHAVFLLLLPILCMLPSLHRSAPSLLPLSPPSSFLTPPSLTPPSFSSFLLPPSSLLPPFSFHALLLPLLLPPSPCTLLPLPSPLVPQRPICLFASHPHTIPCSGIPSDLENLGVLFITESGWIPLTM